MEKQTLKRRLLYLDKENKETMLKIVFHPKFKENKVYIAVERSLPPIAGLKQSGKRREVAYDIVKAMQEKGLKIST